jgi:hypothetical protein
MMIVANALRRFHSTVARGTFHIIRTTDVDLPAVRESCLANLTMAIVIPSGGKSVIVAARR